ncbi:killer cell lectin-like receptor subfamily B member 1B allele C isoform X2 [Ambystoma mexicanum]|uniref:killer cell lectin-like receptor subfamily B member 1B allele C isoform X2 n=1 Tax=Ambystoma mexicanum TaxID=8296 RepID=UPI0037E98365
MALDVVYAEITIRGAASRNNPQKHAAWRCAGPQCRRWHRHALCISGMLHIIAVLSFIGVGSWVFQVKQQKSAGTGSRSACELEESSGSNVALCPADWLIYRGKCYYFQEHPNTWSQSNDYCNTMDSHLAVIQDKDELEFIANHSQESRWIGLFNTTPGGRWTWVDGSTYNEHKATCGLQDVIHMEQQATTIGPRRELLSS